MASQVRWAAKFSSIPPHRMGDPGEAAEAWGGKNGEPIERFAQAGSLDLPLEVLTDQNRTGRKVLLSKHVIYIQYML